METYIRPPRTGLEAFELMPEGTLCQLINDTIVMSPAPTTPHARVQREIFDALNFYVKKSKSGEVFFAPVDVYLNEKNVFQPDIFYLNKEQLPFVKRKGVYGAPSLVIEILSEGNKRYDRKDKKDVYEKCGVKEYWIIDPETKNCKGFVLENNFYKAIEESTAYFSIQLLNLSIRF
jgi:Uma2 family endonuclease